MGKVLTHMTMSLDGFIADPNDQVGELFEWYEAGDVTVPSSNENISFQPLPRLRTARCRSWCAQSSRVPS